MNTPTGTAFGRWVTVGVPYRESNQTLVQCRCECGTESVVNIFNIDRGDSESCGCKSSPTLSMTPGTTVGRWKLIERPFVDGIVTKAKCQCECGTERTIRLAQAINGTSISCGCSRRRLTDRQKKEKAAAHTRAWNAKWYPIYRERAFAVLGGKKCCRCGIDDPRVLAFDHINGGGGAERKKTSGLQILKRIVSDPGRFRVLCLNCNWIAHKHPEAFEEVA